MSINNNRSLLRDYITDGWTKKDWVLNLIPGGGIAAIAYKIGSACLSSGDRAAKISEDLYKSPVQAAVKGVAQCLWAPIVVCGSLKLACFIVQACWNRCFPPAISDDLTKIAEDPSGIIPEEVFVDCIFSYLNLRELIACRSVSKKWSRYVNTPIIWQRAIYREIAFSSVNWKELNANLTGDVDITQEVLSLPKNIVEILRQLAFPKKSIRETHVLVRMPKGLTIKKLEAFAVKHFNKHPADWSPDRCKGNWSDFVKQLGKVANESVDKPVWLLMTQDVFNPKSPEKSPKNSNRKALPDYQAPTTLEAITCILAGHLHSKKLLFSNSPYNYTRCKERIKGLHIHVRVDQVIVGSCKYEGVRVNYGTYAYQDIGVAALWKFSEGV